MPIGHTKRADHQAGPIGNLCDRSGHNWLGFSRLAYRGGGENIHHHGEKNCEQGHGQEERREEEAGKVAPGETRSEEGEEAEPRVSDLRRRGRSSSANCRFAWGPIPELRVLCLSGDPLDEVVRAVTASAADMLGWEDRVGAIEPGKFADLIAVTKDPLADITELGRVRFVMKDGKMIRNDLSPD